MINAFSETGTFDQIYQHYCFKQLDDSATTGYSIPYTT